MRAGYQSQVHWATSCRTRSASVTGDWPSQFRTARPTSLSAAASCGVTPATGWPAWRLRKHRTVNSTPRRTENHHGENLLPTGSGAKTRRQRMAMLLVGELARPGAEQLPRKPLTPTSENGVRNVPVRLCVQCDRGCRLVDIGSGEFPVAKGINNREAPAWCSVFRPAY